VLEFLYRDLIRIRDAERPECIMYLNGYDFALPSGKPAKYLGIKKGPWLKPVFDEHQINFQDGEAVVRWLVDEFNGMLSRLAGAHTGVVHVKTTGTLGPNEWKDEIHPTKGGFGKVAEEFRKQLVKQFPGTF